MTMIFAGFPVFGYSVASLIAVERGKLTSEACTHPIVQLVLPPSTRRMRITRLVVSRPTKKAGIKAFKPFL
jgi:hypothetical protein